MHEQWMRMAIAEAATAAALGEVPVGAVIVQGSKEIVNAGNMITYAGNAIARAGNRRESNEDATAHAEMLAIQAACAVLGMRRLAGCTLYVTLEPCPMCAGAIALAQLDAVCFGAADPKGGCCGSVYRITEDPALHLGKVPAYGGILAAECAALLTDFFTQRR